MWQKVYVTAIAVLVLCLLNVLGYVVAVLDEKNDLQKKYGVPTKCVANTVCAMSGNIILLWLIYICIPDSYYEQLIELTDIRGINKTTKKYV